MLIVEGMDGSGKSTLAAILSKNPYHPQGHPKDYTEALPYMVDQVTMLNSGTVLDRCTCVSTMAYRLDQPLDGKLMDMALSLHERGAIFIYCRPPTELMLDIASHEPSEFDTAYTLKILKDHAAEIITRYDKIFSVIPHIRYDYTKGIIHESQTAT